MPNFSTNIRVSATTYERLEALKQDGESFDAALQRALDGESDSR
jgi:predicted CopG family antitoxin